MISTLALQFRFLRCKHFTVEPCLPFHCCQWLGPACCMNCYCYTTNTVELMNRVHNIFAVKQRKTCTLHCLPQMAPCLPSYQAGEGAQACFSILCFMDVFGHIYMFTSSSCVHHQWSCGVHMHVHLHSLFLGAVVRKSSCIQSRLAFAKIFWGRQLHATNCVHLIHICTFSLIQTSDNWVGYPIPVKIELAEVCLF